jgi:isocitrate dehydrogenase (NAD+)
VTTPVCVIEGDGVGPEVVAAARAVLERTGVDLEWRFQVVGEQALAREGTALPAAVVDAVRECGLALKGPTATPVGAGFASVNVALRRELDLYLGVRPCKAYAGTPAVASETDLMVIRMNHEDLYAGFELAPDDLRTTALLRSFGDKAAALGDDTGVSLKPLSSSGARRAARGAMRFARDAGRTRVTVVHKANVMRQTDGLFLAAAREVAAEFPELEVDDRLVDSACAELVRRPEKYDVLLLPTLYGDIVSDIGAVLAGGLGMVPGANLGDECAVFEPVHGVVAKHAGASRANPVAAILCGALLLRHAGEADAADRVEHAVAGVVAEGTTVTYDIAAGEPASTSEVAEAIAARV